MFCSSAEHGEVTHEEDLGTCQRGIWGGFEKQWRKGEGLLGDERHASRTFSWWTAPWNGTSSLLTLYIRGVLWAERIALTSSCDNPRASSWVGVPCYVLEGDILFFLILKFWLIIGYWYQVSLIKCVFCYQFWLIPLFFSRRKEESPPSLVPRNFPSLRSQRTRNFFSRTTSGNKKLLLRLPSIKPSQRRKSINSEFSSLCCQEKNALRSGIRSAWGRSWNCVKIWNVKKLSKISLSQQVCVCLSFHWRRIARRSFLICTRCWWNK